jgi:hypothetical protein
MLGCCGCEQEKFRNEDGTVDPQRLDAITAGLRVAGWTEAQVAKVVACDCPCHRDGSVCLC